MNTKKWTTKDGTKIRIKDMSDRHLINTIKFLDRQFEQLKMNIPVPTFNGEIAQYMADLDYDYFMNNATPAKVYPIYDDLYAEAIRRELT